MTDSTNVIVWFDQIGKDDVALVGGKGANLGEMTRHQIPVPPGFVVSTHAYRQFVEAAGLEATIHAELDGLEANDTAKLNAVSANVRRAFLTAEMPEAIASQIVDAYGALAADLVAVRSSATAEDLAEASFAGQQATYLNISGADNVVSAVQRCWASLFEGRAIFYRIQTGFDHASIDLAVPVQEMVQSEVSGIMFTINPITGDDSSVMIEAVHGLGEAAVSGMVTPDSYIASKDPLVVQEAAVTPQSEQLVYTPDQTDEAGEHNTWQPVAAELRDQRKLNDDQVLELTAIGTRLADHYGVPQDIEWAWAQGQFHLLQTRPVTVAGGIS
jgi:pyruvate,water dikinase